MKALFIADEINQFHWSMLKSVLLILSLLPLSQFFISLLQHTDGNSQIMVGFMVISVFSAISIISFCSALHASVMHVQQDEQPSAFEQMIVKLYRYIPMLSLAVMMSYLATQF